MTHLIMSAGREAALYIAPAQMICPLREKRWEQVWNVFLMACG